MIQTAAQNKMIALSLGTWYKRAVQERTGKKYWGKIPEKAVLKIAGELESPRLARIFIHSQFHAMPVKFCMSKFKVPYPPSNVCCGGRCWYRYEEYLSRGVDDGS